MNQTLSRLHSQIHAPQSSPTATRFQQHSSTRLFPRKSCLTCSSSARPHYQGFARYVYPPSCLIRYTRTCTSSSKFSGSLEPDLSSNQEDNERENNKVLKILKGANSIIPQVVLASTVLALVYPPSFTWFTTRYYAPALGFLMFAVGVNSSEKDFIEAFHRPAAIVVGYVGQFVIKPFLGYLFGTMAVTVFNLPTPLGAGIMLVSCVSGAQLSNYATFLTDPPMAPLSIVMTSLSTATAVFVTPALSLLLIGKRLPVDVRGMVSSIMQIVITPIAAGLLLNRFFPRICGAIRPLLPPLSVFVTALCVGSPLAINIEAVMSPYGLTVLLLIIGFHLSSFIAGYMFTGLIFSDASDTKALQRTLSFETGMQSSLLALALANRFFQDPLVGVPPAISEHCRIANTCGWITNSSLKIGRKNKVVNKSLRGAFSCFHSSSVTLSMLGLRGCYNVADGILSRNAMV